MIAPQKTSPRAALLCDPVFDLVANTEAAASARTPVPPMLLCDCHGCRQHTARLEALNAELAAEVDRLRRSTERRRAA